MNIWIGAVLGAWASSAAPESDVLEQRELVELVQQHPTLRSRRAVAKGAAAGAMSAAGRPVPRVEVMAAPATVVAPVEGVDPGLSLTLAQPFAPPGLVRRSRRAAAERAQVAAAAVDVGREELVRDALLAFADRWFVAAADEVLAAHELRVVALVDRARRRYEAGTGRAGDVLAAELAAVAVADRRAGLAARAGALDAQLRWFAGRPDWEVPLPVLPDASVVDPTSAAPARLVVAEGNVRAAEAERQVARARRGPRAAVMGQYSSMWAMPAHRWMVGGSVELPLDGRVQRGRVEQAQAAQRAAEAQGDAARLRVAADVAEARAVLAAAEARLGLARDRRRPLAAEQLRATEEAYEAGLVDLTQVLEAAGDVLDAELATAEARARQDQARHLLAYAEGRL